MKNFKLLILILFTINLFFTQVLIAQNFTLKNNSVKGNYAEKFKANFVSDKVKIEKYFRGEIKVYRQNANVSLEKVEFIEATFGDFNEDGIEDVFALILIKDKSRTEYNISLVQIEKDSSINIKSYIQYDEIGFREYKVNRIIENNLQIQVLVLDINRDVFSDRIIYLSYDAEDFVHLHTICKLDAMQDRNIFKEISNVERKYFINGNLENEQHEIYDKDNVNIKANTIGCDDFTLRFMIYVEIEDNESLDAHQILLEQIEFLETNTRYSSLLTRVEKICLQKIENKSTFIGGASNPQKNIIDDNTYFSLGMTLDRTYYFIDLLIYEPVE